MTKAGGIGGANGAGVSPLGGAVVPVPVTTPVLVTPPVVSLDPTLSIPPVSGATPYGGLDGANGPRGGTGLGLAEVERHRLRSDHPQHHAETTHGGGVKGVAEAKAEIARAIPSLAAAPMISLYARSGERVFTGSPQQLGAFVKGGRAGDVGSIEGGSVKLRFGAKDGGGFIHRNRAGIVLDALVKAAAGLAEPARSTKLGATAIDPKTLAALFELAPGKLPLPSSFVRPVVGNMFGDDDQVTLAGRVIASIYDRLVQRGGGHTPRDAMEVLELGRRARKDFEAAAKEAGIPFWVARPAGASGFHLDGEDGRVSRDHLFYFSKSKREWRDSSAPEIRAYITLDPSSIEQVQRHFVALVRELNAAGIDFTAKAASPNGLDRRLDNMVFYLSAPDQAKAAEIIKRFLTTHGIGRGHVAAALASPQDGLSWAVDPSPAQHRQWQLISGSTQPASYNAWVAAMAVPDYLERLAAAHQKAGNTAAATELKAEAERVRRDLNAVQS